MSDSDYLISIDQSLRSTGVCVFKLDKLFDFFVIKTKLSEDNVYIENDFIKIWVRIETYIMDNLCSNHLLSHDYPDFVFEGLSLNSKSSMKDIISGLHWFLRTMVKYSFPNSLIGVIPPREWRNHYITKEEMKIAKQKYKKNTLKEVVKEKTDIEIRNRFDEYIQQNKFNYETMFDLCDSYAMGKYRLTFTSK